MRRWYSLLSVLAAGACMLAFLSGCAKAPDDELAAAKAAFKAAQDAEADKYMANNFQNLQEAVTAAEAEVTLQKGKFALSQNYARAKLLLKNATDLATKITADAPGAKVEMRKQVEEGLASVKKMILETRVEVKKAAKSKEKKVRDQMAANLDQADKTLIQAAADFSAGNILGAAKKLADAQNSLKKVFDKLSCGGSDNLM